MNNRLPHLKAVVHEAHAAVGRHERAAAERALEAGAALIEARAIVGHGGWSSWLAESAIPQRSAQRYMALARGGPEPASVANLGLAEAARLAGLGHRLWPKDDRIRHAEGLDGDHFAEACWQRVEGGRVAYSATHLIGGTSPLVLRYPAISKPWLLGLFHDGFPSLEGQIMCQLPEDVWELLERSA
jgi:hypothetical protein